MKTQLDISKLLEFGKIQNELDFERALIADRKLRVLSKEDSKYKVIRKKLRDLIEDYENKNWSSSSRITDKKIRESDLAELIAEKERQFIQNRKELIRKKLKNLNLTQQNLGAVLGHRSKSYMSELMNGVSPFSKVHCQFSPVYLCSQIKPKVKIMAFPIIIVGITVLIFWSHLRPAIAPTTSDAINIPTR